MVEQYVSLPLFKHLIRGSREITPCPALDNYITPGIHLRIVAALHINNLGIPEGHHHRGCVHGSCSPQAEGDIFPALAELLFDLR